MDLSISNTSFGGKKEVLYGISKAANNVHSFGVYQQPRLMRFGENPNIAKYEAAARAYMDMFTKDDSFIKTVKNIDRKDLAAEREMLKEQGQTVSKYNPMPYFKEFLETTMQRNKTYTVEGKEAFEMLIEKLS